MENVTKSTGWKARIAENWQRSRRTVRNYFLLIFLLGLILGMWGRWFMHFIYVPAIVVAYFLGRHFA